MCANLTCPKLAEKSGYENRERERERGVPKQKKKRKERKKNKTKKTSAVPKDC